MFKFTIRDLLFVTVIVGVAIGWVTDRRRQDAAHADQVKKLEGLVNQRPYKVQRFYANGEVSRDWWERKLPDGETERLWDLGSTYFYSNGATASKLYSGDESLARYYSPNGAPISPDGFYDFYLRDLGDGTFAESLPPGDGRPSRMAKENEEQPKSL